MSDTSVDNLSQIAHDIQNYCIKYARLGGDAKEKYGTVRFYVKFCGLTLHDLIYPGYVFIQFPVWLNNIDAYVISPVLHFLFGKIYYKWQKFIYNRAYQKALAKYPNFKDAILSCCDYPEFINGAQEYFLSLKIKDSQ